METQGGVVMADELSPVARLEELEKQAVVALEHLVELEAKVIVLDHIVGILMNTGQRPSPAQIAGFWTAAAEALRVKYPGLQLIAKVEPQPKAPTLYVPTNGKAIHLN